MTSLLHQARPFVDSFIDVVFPPRCGACGAMVEQQGRLCGECWAAIDFISAPFCSCCGLPFDYQLAEDALCGQCIKRTPPYAHMRSVFRYEPGSKRQILGLKYYDRTVMVPAFGKWLAHAGQEFISTAEVIVPVPLHPLRLIRRKYNQAALLAYALAQEIKIPVLPDGLTRIRHTAPQASLSREKRLKNLHGVFKVSERYYNHMQGRRVLLIDDVITTGATVNACCKALKRGGVAEINVLTLARTVI